MSERIIIDRIIINCLNICRNIGLFFGERISFIIAVISFSTIGVALIVKPFFDLQYCGYLAIICLMFATGFSVKTISDFKRKNLFFLIPVLLLAITFIVSALIFKDGNRVILGLCFSLMVPMITIALGDKENFERFFKAYGIGSEIIFIFLLIVSVIFAPFIDAQYSSIMMNPNGLSVVLIAIIFGTICVIEYSNKNNGKRNIYILKHFSIILLAFEIAFMILTRSRTGILALTSILIIWVIFLLINSKKGKDVVKSVAIVFISCIIAFVFTTEGLARVNVAILQKEYSIFGQVYFFTTTTFVVSDDKFEIENGDISAAAKGALERMGKGIGANGDFSSGRFAIWGAAIKSMNITGHGPGEEFLVPERDLSTNDAHNMILTIGFQLGYIGAALAFLIALINGGYFIKLLYLCIKSKKMTIVSAQYMMICSAFFIVAMLSSTYTPIGSMLGIGFWCALPIVKGVIYGEN